MNTKLRSSLVIFSAIGVIATLTGCHTPTTKTASAMPCMDVLPLFTAANVPAFAPSEIACSEPPLWVTPNPQILTPNLQGLLF